MSTPFRILVYRLGSLGDTLVALPALHWIRAKFPGSEITLLTNWPINDKASPASLILDGTGLIDHYLAYPLATRNIVELLHLRRKIARRRFDIVFTLVHTRGLGKSIRDWLFLRSCGIPKVTGSVLRQPDRICVPDAAGELYEREAARLIRRVGAEGKLDLGDNRWWDLRLDSKERFGAKQLLEQSGISTDFIALSMGTKFEVNDWTMPNWKRLVQELGRQHSRLGLIGFGVAGERQKTEEVLRFWPGARLNLCGSLSPRMSGAVLEQAKVFVGHDSGPLHLAAAVGVKCVAIFSARNPPGQWFPRGDGHQVLYHRTECFNCGLSVCENHAKKCILGISVEEVVGAVTRLVEGPGRSAPGETRSQDNGKTKSAELVAANEVA